MNRHAIRLALFVIGLALTFPVASFGARQVVRVGNLYLADNGGISPLKLPRRGKAPVTARLVGEIGTVDGSHPPALRSVALDIDRTIGIDAVGLPICREARLVARPTAEVERACGRAIVGSGKAEVEVAFPEQAPFSATGPVVLLNGGVRGRTTLVLLHAYVAVPAPTAVVTRATVTRVVRGRFGLHIEARIPRIAGGYGSVTRFELKVGRKFTHRGRQKSFLMAGCPTGRWTAKGDVRFEDGTQLGLTHVFPCTPKG